jgi:uncharacterized membrane protein (UPF0127 family)
VSLVRIVAKIAQGGQSLAVLPYSSGNEMVISRITSKAVMRVTIVNTTKNTVVCMRGTLANTMMLRMVGLLGVKGLEPEAGLLIKPSSGVHTFGMRFPIDIVTLDRNNRVLGIWENIGPWRIRGLSLRTRSVLELPSGRIKECSIEAGDELAVKAA